MKAMAIQNDTRKEVDRWEVLGNVAHGDSTRELQQPIHDTDKKYVVRYQKLYEKRKLMVNETGKGISGFWL